MEFKHISTSLCNFWRIFDHSQFSVVEQAFDMLL